MDKYKAIAKYKEILMRLRLTFESIGIDFYVNDNKEIYIEIICQILSGLKLTVLQIWVLKPAHTLMNRKTYNKSRK